MNSEQNPIDRPHRRGTFTQSVLGHDIVKPAGETQPLRHHVRPRTAELLGELLEQHPELLPEGSTIIVPTSSLRSPRATE